MKQYLSLFKIRFVNTLQYRTAAFAGLLTQGAFGLMYILLFKAFYAQGNVPAGFTVTQMMSYIWLQQIFFVLFFPVNNNAMISSQIEQGNLCYELVRPMNLYANWFTTLYSERLSKTLLRFIPISILAFCLPASLGISLPVSVPAFLLFVFNLIIASMLVIAINTLAYCLMMKTMSSIGIFSIISTITSLFSGAMVPLPLTPSWFQKICEFLPFSYINDLTFRTYVGSIPLNQALVKTVIQVVWLIALVLIGNFWVKKNLKKVEVQGG